MHWNNVEAPACWRPSISLPLAERSRSHAGRSGAFRALRLRSGSGLVSKKTLVGAGIQAVWMANTKGNARRGETYFAPTRQWTATLAWTDEKCTQGCPFCRGAAPLRPYHHTILVGHGRGTACRAPLLCVLFLIRLPLQQRLYGGQALGEGIDLGLLLHFLRL